MTDYTKLVAALQNNDWADACPCCDEAMCKDADCIILQAAAAIEELDAEETRLLLLTSDLQDKLMDLQELLNDSDVAAEDDRRQIEKLAKRNTELHAELEKWVSAAEGLQAEVKRLELDNEDYEYTLRERYDEPKRGEWLNVTDSWHWYGKCSVCGEEFVVDAYYAGGMNYCPNCGAKMKEVQE